MADRTPTTGRWLVPFLLAGALPFAILPLPGPGLDLVLGVVGAVLTLAIALGAALTPWHRLSPWWTLVPAFGYLAAVAILREAGGGNISGLGPLAIVPAIGVALLTARRVLPVVAVGVALVYWVPMLIDVERYPESGWRIGLLLACMSGFLGVAIHRLREKLAAQAESLRALALEDELTGLPNRRAWTGAVDGALARAARDGEPLCVAVVDVDDFKGVNDSGGHAAGDRLLMTLSAQWSEAVRGGDVLARLGGDEFGVLMTAIGFEDAVTVVERIRECTDGVTCSIGLTQWDGEEPAEALLARADALLYDAKRLGRDRVEAVSAAALSRA